MRTSIRLSSAIAAFLVLLSACGSDVSTDQWEQDWRTLLDQLPAAETMLVATGDQATELCGDALGTLRTAATDLQATSDADLEAAAITFVDFAESVFFECPIRSGDFAGFEAGFEEMDHLRLAVEALLADDQ